MPRTLGSAVTAGMYAQQSAVVLLDVIEIDHDDLDAPILLVRNTEDISVGGETYTACGITITPPAEKDSGVPRAQIEISNPLRALTPTIRTLSGDLWMTLKRVSVTDAAADPPEFDTVEQVYLPLRLLNLTYDSKKIRGQLTFSTGDQNQFPAGQFTPQDFAGLF